MDQIKNSVSKTVAGKVLKCLSAGRRSIGRMCSVKLITSLTGGTGEAFDAISCTCNNKRAS